MGCTGSKNKKKRDTLSQEAEKETAREHLAAARDEELLHSRPNLSDPQEVIRQSHQKERTQEWPSLDIPTKASEMKIKRAPDAGGEDSVENCLGKMKDAEHHGRNSFSAATSDSTSASGGQGSQGRRKRHRRRSTRSGHTVSSTMEDDASREYEEQRNYVDGANNGGGKNADGAGSTSKTFHSEGVTSSTKGAAAKVPSSDSVDCSSVHCVKHGAGETSELGSSIIPPVLDTKVYPSADVLDDTGSKASGITGVHAVGSASHKGEEEKEHDVCVVEKTATAPSTTTRSLFEPFNGIGRSGDDPLLPPYEWAPRTQLIPAPRSSYEEGFTSAPIQGDGSGAVIHFVDPSSANKDLVNSASAQRYTSARSHPLVLHTFYPRPPLLQRPSGAARGDYQLPAVDAEAIPHSRSESGALARQPQHRVPQREPPAYQGDLFISSTHAATPFASGPPMAPPSLIDVDVLESDVSPLSHVHPASTAALHTASLEVGSYSDPTAGHVEVVSVGAHQYKPITYLFDSPLDTWLHSRRVPSQQRGLYAETAGIW